MAIVKGKPVFFTTQAKWRAWLKKNHASFDEFWVGFHKRDSGRLSITWPQSVDEALCFGWIDGVRYSIDETSYMIRFTQRRPGSRWSAVNLKRVKELIALGVMHPTGSNALEKGSKESAGYSYERETAQLGPAFEKKFRATKAAWSFYRAQPPWYRRTSAWWVISAKKEETKLRRLDQLIACSAKQQPIPQLTRKK